MDLFWWILLLDIAIIIIIKIIIFYIAITKTKTIDIMSKVPKKDVDAGVFGLSFIVLMLLILVGNWFNLWQYDAYGGVFLSILFIFGFSINQIVRFILSLDYMNGKAIPQEKPKVVKQKKVPLGWQIYHLLSVFDKPTSPKKDDLDWTGLEEWEKEKIINGEDDIYSFEEEELEDDDYYYEDDV